MTEGHAVSRPRVLCVDDNPAVLAMLNRVLRGANCEVVTADSAVEALEHVQGGPPFAVVVSDYRMPHTDGVTLLGWIRDVAPDTVPILLTGSGDLETAVDAVNRGQVFRVLSKPAPIDVLRAAVKAASDHHQLVTAERVLLEQTLHGSIKALIDVLALAQPDAFGRATRVQRYASGLAKKLNLPDRWSIEIAAMLSQVGCTALPAETINRYFLGERLSDDEQAVVANLPVTAERLIAGIPRLNAVREILRFSDTRYSGHGAGGMLTQLGVQRDAIPVGARILKLVLDFDLLEMRGLASSDALHSLKGRTNWYDPALLDAFSELHGVGMPSIVMQEIRLAQVRVGMVFAADVRADNGVLLVARGQEVNASLVERIRYQWQSFAARYVVSMLVPAQA